MRALHVAFSPVWFGLSFPRGSGILDVCLCSAGVLCFGFAFYVQLVVSHFFVMFSDLHFPNCFCVLGFCMCESDTQQLLYSSFTRAKAEQYTSGIREAAETGIEATCAHHRARHAQNVYLV